MKKNWLIVLSILGIFLLFGSAFGLAAQQITIIFDGEKLDCDVAPVMENGRVLVPVRIVAEALDFQVEWSPSAQVVHIVRDNTIISIGVDGKITYINNDALEIDIPARIIEGRTLVPFRFVSEALGAGVEWQEDKRMVVIKDKQRYYDQALLYLRQSNLPNARREALLAPVKTVFPPVTRDFSDMAKTTYYFPEGEAFRFYTQEGDRLSYIETINNVFTKSWEANLGGHPLEGPESTLSKYLAAHGKGYTAELGLRPLITEPLGS